MDIENEIFFREEQRFNGWILVPVFISPVIIATILAASMRDDTFGADAIPGLAIGLAVTLAVAMLFVFLKLVTEVRGDGVYIRFFPLHLRFKRFGFDEIRTYYARRYKPLLEYGGWGIRWGKGGRAYNVKGDVGLQLEMEDNKKVLIGSQRAEELAAAMSKAIP